MWHVRGSHVGVSLTELDNELILIALDDINDQGVIEYGEMVVPGVATKYDMCVHYTFHAKAKHVVYVQMDAKGVFDAVHNSNSTALGLTEKRSGIELQGLRDSLEELRTDVR